MRDFVGAKIRHLGIVPEYVMERLAIWISMHFKPTVADILYS
jgi:hypothetical protein